MNEVQQIIQSQIKKLEINEENKRIKEKNQRMKEENQRMKEENQRMKEENQSNGTTNIKCIRKLYSGKTTT